MESNKEPKKASSSNQQSDTDDILRKDEQNVSAKSTGATSPANDIVPSSNHQDAPPILQRPRPTQTSKEQPSSSSAPGLPSQSQSPFVIGQWHQSPNPQLNPNGHRGAPPPHLSQSAAPFWVLHHPGYHYPRVNSPAVFQPFAPLGTTNVTWQVHGVVRGRNASKEHHLVPYMCYPYPTFPGPWNPSFSEAHHYFSSQPPTMPASTSSPGQSVARGVIRTPVKLSQKNQKLWEAQSAENVQLRTVIDQLKSEIADYKSQIMNLQTEVSSLKQLVEEPTAHVNRTYVSGQGSKRVRPKKSVASVDATPSSDDYKHRTRSRRPADKSQMENKSSGLVYVQVKEKTCEATAISQQEGVIASNGVKEGENKNDQILPSFHTKALQQLPQFKVSAVGLNSSAETKSRDAKFDNPNDPFTVTSPQAKGTGAKSSMAQFSGPENGEHIAGPTVMGSEDSERNVLNTTSQVFYNSNKAITQDGKMVQGWIFVNKEDASNELEDAGSVSSAKGGNDEMADDGSSDP